jgi:signal transduction histidine kinase
VGLAFCRLAVQGHGGQIWVESQPGNGSKFILTLPVVKEK